MKQSLTRGSQLTGFERFIKQANQTCDIYDPGKAVWLVNWPAFDKPNCSVYVVSTDSRWPCKIGISINPYNRIKGIQTGVWRPVSVHKCFHVPSVKEARSLEKKVHQTLTDQGKWLHGEWFDLRPEQTVELIQFEALVLGIDCRDRIDDPEIEASLKTDLIQAGRRMTFMEGQNIL